MSNSQEAADPIEDDGRCTARELVDRDAVEDVWLNETSGQIPMD
jgi:hypothetical protein